MNPTNERTAWILPNFALLIAAKSCINEPSNVPDIKGDGEITNLSKIGRIESIMLFGGLLQKTGL